jgi:hypothetical protein
VWTWRGLVTYYTVFVINLATRRVQILGSTPHPDEAFMQQERWGYFDDVKLMQQLGAMPAPRT